MSLIKVAFIHYKTLGPNYRKQLKDHTNEVANQIDKKIDTNNHVVRNTALYGAATYGTLGGILGGKGYFTRNKLKGSLVGIGAGLAVGSTVGALSGIAHKSKLISMKNTLKERNKRLNNENSKWIVFGGTKKFRETEK